MHLIAPLVTGVNGASNGTAKIYKRGQSSRATYYTQFEDASGGLTSDITLDSNGGYEAYVNELVDVQVLDSSGTEVRRFVAGGASSAVEARSQSFTGTDYETGQQAASNPVDLNAVLDLWKTSAGTLDFKVLVDGAATLLQNAIPAKVFYNVKESTYGATGDGSTDDTTAVQAAINAANTAGGGIVWFPKGTYNVTNLTCYATVSLWGVNPASSTLRTTSTTGNLLSWASGEETSFVEVRGLSLGATVAITEELVHARTSIRFSQCVIGDSNCTLTDKYVVLHDPTNVFTVDELLYMDNCLVRCGGSASRWLSTLRANITNSRFRCLATAWNPTQPALLIGSGSITGCEFDSRDATSGTHSFIHLKTTASATGVVVVGCVFMANSGSTATAFESGGATTAEVFMESGNAIDANVSRLSGTFNELTANKGYVADHRGYSEVATSDDPYDFDTNEISTIVITHSGTACTIGSSVTIAVHEGAALNVFLRATNAAGCNVDFDSATFDAPLAAVAVAQNLGTGWRFVNVNGQWRQCGDAATPYTFAAV